MGIQSAMVSSKSNEWATPQDLFDKLNEEFHFTLDVAATLENRKCEMFYSIENNGLEQEWNDSNFMNPPYGGQTRKWIKKAYQESLKGRTTVCLIVSATERSYWHDFIFPFASQIRFVRGKLHFNESKTSAPFASAIVIFSPKTYEDKFTYDYKGMDDNARKYI